MPSPFLSENVFLWVFGAFFLLYVIAAVQSQRRSGREKKAWEALALQAARRGWQWQQRRPMRPQRPAGLDGQGLDPLPAWLITGTRGERPWTLEQSLSRRRGGEQVSSRGTTFRGLLTSPPPYGVHILPETKIATTALVPGVAGYLRRGVAEQARKATLDSPLSADDLASIVVPNTERRVDAPRALDRLGYAALVTQSGAERASHFLEQIAPVVAGWVQMSPDHPIDLLIVGAELQVSVRGALMDFGDVERLVNLGLATLDAVEGAP